MIHRLLVTAVLLTSCGLAQQATTAAPPFTAQSGPPTANVTVQRIPVSRSDIYCSGYITRQAPDRTKFVAGGLESPHTARFVERDLVFLKGSGYKPGDQISILREWRNPDEFDVYKDASKMLAETGQPYQDIGYGRIVELRGADIAVARLEFGCDAAVVGDLVVPFIERPSVTVSPTVTLDRFPAEKPSLQGKIVLAAEGDQFISRGRKVYLNIGWEKGVKAGDYLMVTRGYTADETDEADNATLNSTVMEDTQQNPPKFPNKNLGELPRRLLGEVVVINATPVSATAMVTFMVEEMHVGDNVELEAAQAPPSNNAGSE